MLRQHVFIVVFFLSVTQIGTLSDSQKSGITCTWGRYVRCNVNLPQTDTSSLFIYNGHVHHGGYYLIKCLLPTYLSLIHV